MKRSAFALLFILFASSLVAQSGTVYSINSSVINFKSEAPFEVIKASSKDLAGLLDTKKKNFAFRVKIQSFQGFNSALQREHFNENYMESNSYPEASFDGKIIEDIDFSKDGFYTIRAKGKLLVHGVPQERIIKVDITIKEGKMNFKSMFTVLLADHNIPIPKVVKDKLASEIKVEVTGQLVPR